MSDVPASPGPLRLDGILPLLPDSEELRSVVELLLARSRPDPGRRWSGSGELGTAGSRLVDAGEFREGLDQLAAAEGRRLARIFQTVGALADALGRGDMDEAIDRMLAESEVLEREGRPDESLRWTEAGAELARTSGSPRLAEALRRQARCARTLGALDRAEALYEEAFRRARVDGGWNDRVVAATGRGNVSVDRGLWEEAERWYRRALALIDDPESTLEPDRRRALRWRLHQNLGITARERGALDESERHYREADEESAMLDDPAARIEIENGRGQLELARGEARRAEGRFRRALVELGGEAGEAGVVLRVNLGRALLAQGRTLQAGEAAREAEAIALQGRALRRLPEVYRLLAEVARARREPEAFVFLERALELIRTRGLPAFQEALTLEAYALVRAADGEKAAATGARDRARAIFEELGIARPEVGQTDPAEGGDTE